MSKSLDQLGLKDEALPTAGADLGDLPEFGTFQPPPPPGPYRMRLPGNLSGPIYDVYDVNGKGQRVRVIFDRDHPLLITQSKAGTKNGEPFETRINNNERSRGKSGAIASDWDYLLRALGEKQKPANNKAYIVALQKHAGKEFGCDISYSWSCSPERDIRVVPAGGGTPTVVEGQKGCGEKYYAGDVPAALKVNGELPYEIPCQCGARLRAFANLENYRP